MKLTNQQIDALASDIFDKHNSKRDKLELERRKIPSVVANAKKAFAIYSKFDAIAKKKINRYSSGYKLDDFIDAYADEIKLDFKYLKVSDIKNQIIIASIDSKDVEEIKSKLKLD